MFGKPTVGEILASAKQALSQSLGSHLLSVIHYGMHVDDDQTTKAGPENNVRLLIVVDDLNGDHWDLAAQGFDSIVGHQWIAPMLMTADELETSTDVFPITFLEMRRHYRLIAGTDVLQDLVIEQVHLRLRCEQELKNLLLRMQSTYLAHHGSASRLKNALGRNMESFIRAMTGAISLTGQSPPREESQLLALAIETFGLDNDAVNKATSMVTDISRADHDWVKSLYVSMMSVVQKSAAVMDQFAEDVVVVEVIEEDS